MAALTADANLVSTEAQLYAYPMADNIRIYKDSLVCVNASGYAVVGADTAGYQFVGHAYEDVDNTTTGHSAGGKSIRVYTDRIVTQPATGMGQSSVGQPVFVSDSATVCLQSGSTNNIMVGLVVGYHSATSVDILSWPDARTQVSVANTQAIARALTLSPAPTDTYAATMTIDTTYSRHVINASSTTSATVTLTPSAAPPAGSIVVIETIADSSGTVTATFASVFHPSGTQATTASHFSTIAFLSDGTRLVELFRTTALA